MFVLKNKMGLYLMGMGSSRNDHSFTKEISQALSFAVRQDAEARKYKLPMLKLTIEEVNSTS